MTGIGSKTSSAAKIIAEAVVAPTVSTINTEAARGIESLTGINLNPKPPQPVTNQSNQSSQKPATDPTAASANRQNIVRFLDTMAEDSKRHQAEIQQQIDLKKQSEEKEMENKKIKQIEVKQKREKMINQAVYDKQRGAEIKKGGA